MADASGHTALGHLRICDFTGQLAGAGATRYLAAFGAQVIRIEDPVREGRWDILRGAGPYLDERRGIELGGAFNNTNVEKLGVTLNLRHERGRALLRRLIAASDVVTENFAAGVLAGYGFAYEAMRECRDDIIYVSNCGFGHSGPYQSFKTWGPIVQAVCGLTFSSGLPGLPPAGYGFSYMDHHGANFMAIAVLGAVLHRTRTGAGQWIDISCTEAGASLTGPTILDRTVNGRPARRTGMPSSNRSQSPAMAPHGIYPARGDDNWLALACRDDDDWAAAAKVIGQAWALDARYASRSGRLAHEDELDRAVSEWSRTLDARATARALVDAGVPASLVARPGDRIDHDPGTEEFGLWPSVEHPHLGRVRVDGLPLHLSETDWTIAKGAPCLGEHNALVYGEFLGLASDEIDELRAIGAI